MGGGLRFCLLASGSKGNAIWVEEGPLAVVIDCGLSAKEFKARAAMRGLDLKKLKAVIISHEHRDHIQGVGPLARSLDLTVIANAATQAACANFVGKVRWDEFATGDTMNFGHLRVQTMSISHDAAEPTAFVIESDSGALGLATDLGAVTNLVRQRLLGLRSLILEFNHDYDRLMEGPYPWPLKQRVRGRTGHLANEEAAELAARLYHSDLKHLVLAHLSQTNNTPELALKAANQALKEVIEPIAAGQDEPTIVFDL
ncbi:MBL fold metallo-hydrolase [Deltaproteobacteria bacterium Smac51]|nr:MBL fold metallo-hydrolase [Deltaproteobacteria bacterium Smac51]